MSPPPSPPHLPPIVALAPHRWDDRWLSRQHLLAGLAARGWRVVYSWGALHLWQRHDPAWRRAPWLGRLEERDGVLVEEPGRLPLRREGWPRWDRRVIAWHARHLRNAVGAPAGGALALLFHPSFWPWVAPLEPGLVAYHVYDVFGAMEDWNPRQEAWQHALVERADLITAASPGMAATLPPPGPEKARLLPNGADAHAFAGAEHLPRPTLLESIPTPRIGYTGTINSKLDLEMVETVALRRPGWHWVMAGPVLFNPNRPRDREALAVWQRCLALPNVHLLPNQPRQAVPALVRHMDVNVVCYRIRPDDWVVHGYPVKLHEYLASGRPVVAAPQEVICRQFGHVTALAHTPGEWEAALERAITGGGVATPQQRRAVALANTWEARVDQLEQWLLEAWERRGGRPPRP